MKKKSLLCITFVFMIILGQIQTLAAGTSAIDWYCLRAKEHKQPLADANLRVIENFDGYYIDHGHGDQCSDKVVYLTFDAGYENGNVEKILDVLKEENVHGAFFILSHLIEKHPSLVIRMGNEGHTVANHTSTHKDITLLSEDELKQELTEIESLYSKATNREMAKFFRPPEGRFNASALGYLQKLGYKTVFWSLAYADWDNDAQPSPEIALKKLCDNVHNGAVILLHPTSSTNAKILPNFIQKLKEEGYRFGSLNELTQQKSNS